MSPASSPVGSDDESVGQYGIDGSTAGTKTRPAAGRGVTLSMLIKSNVLQPGRGLLSIEYLGRRFSGDLSDDGRIYWEEGQRTFASPSAWAIHCKRLVNPEKKSGCGWASVRYRGRKLDQFKALWASQKAAGTPAKHATPPKDSSDSVSRTVKRGSETYHTPIDVTREQPRATLQHSDDFSNTPMVSSSSRSKRKRHSAGTPQHHETAVVSHAYGAAPSSSVAMTLSPSTVVPYQFLSTDMPSTTLVQSVPFDAGQQPFSVTVSSTCLLIMDFHCHLWRDSVVGYLAGQWNAKTNELVVSHAFPCKAKAVDEVNNLLKVRG